MTIWIDGDSCPAKTVAIVESIAKARKIPCVLVCDIQHFNMADSPYVERIYVDTGNNAADIYVLNHMEADDVVITNDTGFASLVLSRRGRAVSRKGFEFTDENITKLMFSRDIHTKARRQAKNRQIRTNLNLIPAKERFSDLLKRVLNETDRKETKTVNVEE